MTAGSFDFICEQGATFQVPMIWKDDRGRPMKLSTWTAKMQVRATATAAIVAELSTANGLIALTNAGGITLNLAEADTIAIEAGLYVYDLTLTSGTGQVVRLIAGKFMVSAAVTR